MLSIIMRADLRSTLTSILREQSILFSKLGVELTRKEVLGIAYAGIFPLIENPILDYR